MNKSVRLPGGWSVNHYQGTEGFLGRLALQPVRCVPTFAELSTEELNEFGPNIQRLQKALSNYWETKFAERLERIYVVSFVEYSEHVHVHVIPRFASLDKVHHGAWEICAATKCPAFPDRYRKTYDSDEAKALVKYLRGLASS